MTSAVLHADTPALLDREIDDLLLHMRGLAVVRDILSGRGASDAEIAAAIGLVWQGRNDRYSELRGRAEATPGAGERRVEMHYIGG